MVWWYTALSIFHVLRAGRFIHVIVENNGCRSLVRFSGQGRG